MKNNIKNNKAFTLAEVALVLFIISVLLVGFVKIGKTRINYYSNKFLFYSAYTNLKTSIAELKAIGCSATDVTNTYCSSATEIPKSGHTADNRGFCDRLTVELLNTVGSISCTQTANDSTTFSSATPNFVTTNGMRFFNFGSNAHATDLYYSVYVDMDGSSGSGILNSDVMKFLVYTNGTVIPATDSIGVNDVNYLSTSVRYKNASQVYVWVLENAGFKESACKSGSVTDATYCGSYTKLADCTTYSCELVISKPGFFLFPQN